MLFRTTSLHVLGELLSMMDSSKERPGAYLEGQLKLHHAVRAS